MGDVMKPKIVENEMTIALLGLYPSMFGLPAYPSSGILMLVWYRP